MQFFSKSTLRVHTDFGLHCTALNVGCALTFLKDNLQFSKLHLSSHYHLLLSQKWNNFWCKALDDGKDDDDDDDDDKEDDDKEDTHSQLVLSGKYFLHGALDLQPLGRKGEQINIKK